VNAFEDIISNMSVQSSLYMDMRFGAPWGIAFDTGSQARIVMIASGRCWMTSRGMAPVLLGPSDCLIVKAYTEFSMADEPDHPLVPCDQVLSNITGRTVEYGGTGSTVSLVSARLAFDPIAGEPLMALLPNIVHVRLGGAEARLLETTLSLIGMETRADGLGAGLVISRLTDVLFVQAIRAWFAGEGDRAPGWLAGLKNRKLAAAIGAMHRNIAFPWTVERMAREAGLSRAGFAATFKEIIGETPLEYLTGWRMYRAKMMLRADHGLTEVAAAVGYESDTALSRAFKRIEGVPPGVWRSRESASAPVWSNGNSLSSTAA
jgi:AraC-like DNA-binding protein